MARRFWVVASPHRMLDSIVLVDIANSFLLGSRPQEILASRAAVVKYGKLISWLARNQRIQPLPTFHRYRCLAQHHGEELVGT